MSNYTIYILLFFMAILLIPIFDSILKSIKAIFNGRRYLHILQTYFDIIKLLRKETFMSQYTSFLSYIGPVIILVNSLIFFFLIPIIDSYININIIYLFYILSLGNFFMILYAMDNSTYFAGLGVEREMFVLSIVESVLIVAIVLLSIISGQSQLSQLNIVFSENIFSPFQIIFYLVLSIVFFYIIVAENKRFPFDNPSTHLELTMIHEAMLLETQGKQLAIMELSAMIKMFGFINLFVFIFLPFTFGIVNYLGLFLLRLLKVFLVVLIIAIWEAIITKIRIFKYQEVFGTILVTQILLIIFYILK